MEEAIKASMRMAPEIVYIGEMRENPEEVKSNLHKKKRFKFLKKSKIKLDLIFFLL